VRARPLGSEFALTTALATALGGLLLGVACGEQYDWNRGEIERGTLGEELFRIWRRDAARAPERSEARVEMLDSHEQQFVDSVDRLAPPDQLGAVDQLFRTTNRSIDSGLLPSLTRKIRIGVENASTDEDLLQALAADGGPSTHRYLADSARPELPVYLLNYDRIRRASETIGGALLASDGLDARGRPADGESTAFFHLQEVVAEELTSLESGDGSPAVDLRDVLLREDDRLRSDRDVELPAVRYDLRGLPRATDTARGEEEFRPVAPFVDDDGDGLADVDSEGRFVLSEGGSREIAPFAPEAEPPLERDADGRALSGGTPAFEYVDLTGTGLHWSLRRLDTLHRKGVHWKILEGLPALLGERVERTDQDEPFRGYGDDQPLLDVLETTLSILDFETLPATLRSLARLFDTQSTDLARLLDAFEEAEQTIDADPDAELSEDSTIGYDLLRILEEISADPDLWSDLLKSLRSEVVSRTGDAIHTLLRFRDRETVPRESGPYEPCFQECKSRFEAEASEEHPHGIGKVGRLECIRGCATEELFTDRTDFEAPDARDNRSNLQQLFHLLRDTAGQPYSMTVERASLGPIDLAGLPPIIELPGEAEAFIRSVAGNLDIENFVSDELRSDPVFGTLMSFLGLDDEDVAGLLSRLSVLFGAKLDEEPTPDQITRLFNQPDLKFSVAGLEIDVRDPVCRDGYVLANHHADKLFAAEASGLIDALQPVAKVFSDHDREELFTALFEVVHEHYSLHDDLYEQKDGTPSPMKGAGVSRFEGALSEIAQSGELFEALQQFAVAIDQVDPDSGESLGERLRQLVHHATRRDRRSGGSLTGPNGERELTLPDGTTVENPSRMHYLIASIGDLVDRVEARPNQEQKLREALRTATDLFFGVEESPGGGPAFEQPGTMAILSLGSRALADASEEWRAEGTLGERLTEEAPGTAEEIVTSRLLPAGVDLARELSATEDRQEAVDELGRHLLGNGAGRDQLAGAAYRLLASTGASPAPPVGDTLGRIVDPDRTWETGSRSRLPILSHTLTLVDRLVERDEPGTGFDLARRGLEKRRGGETHIEAIGEVVGDYYRDDPPSDAPYSVRDYRQVFGELADWLNDDVHGLEQLYDIVGRRASTQ